MADDDGSAGRFRSLVSNGQLLLTLVTAAFSLYLSWQQSNLQKKQADLDIEQKKITVAQSEIKTKQDELAYIVSTKAETEKWAERTLAYVEKLPSIPAAKKEAIIIDLLDAIALANASEQGATDRQKFLQTSSWIALATGNVEALGLIGNANNQRDVWFNLATGSGDATVRTTAMEALARSSASKPLEYLKKIYELSEELNNNDILESALEQIGRVVRVMERDPDPAQFREDDRIKPLVARLEVLRTSLAASAATPGLEAKAAAERRSTLQRQAQGVERALAFLRGSRAAIAVSDEDVRQITSARDTFNVLFNAWDAAPDSEKGKAALADAKAILGKLRPNNQLDGKAVFEALDEEIQQAEPGSAQLTKIRAVFDVKSLIEGLKSTDTDTRRQSRQALANVNDPKATDQLLQELLADKTSYRVRLGVASALYQAKQLIVIVDKNHVRALVELIGDDDVLIRKYASESLMKLTDPETVKLVYDELQRIFRIAHRPRLMRSITLSLCWVRGCGFFHRTCKLNKQRSLQSWALSRTSCRRNRNGATRPRSLMRCCA
jgi:predicted Zn-ribbon and HTH transcriptional regulator